MKILSVNVGLPKTVLINGQPTQTAIFKEPTDGAVKVSKLNLRGDQQADLVRHGRQPRKHEDEPGFPFGHRLFCVAGRGRRREG